MKSYKPIIIIWWCVIAAIAITLAIAITVSNLGGTDEPAEPIPTCWGDDLNEYLGDCLEE